MSKTHTPPEKPSDEADRRQLEIARQQGEAYGAALRYMIDEVANTGDERRAGDFIIAFAQEKAEGMYHLASPGRLEWHDPLEGENCHLEVAVLDAGDRRFLPHLTVRASLFHSDGRQVAEKELPFLWHPGMYHYGANVALPGDGTYTIRVHVDPPSFMRHDRVNGRRYADPVDVEFRDVHVKTGRG